MDGILGGGFRHLVSEVHGKENSLHQEQDSELWTGNGVSTGRGIWPSPRLHCMSPCIPFSIHPSVGDQALSSPAGSPRTAPEWPAHIPPGVLSRGLSGGQSAVLLWAHSRVGAL